MKHEVIVMAGLAGAALCHQGIAQTELPRVLIIGDSISMGYTPIVANILKGTATVVHNPGNAAYSGFGLQNLDKWLGKKKWDVVVFNHGLHDLKYVDKNGNNSTSKETGHIQVPLEQYEKNMEAIVTRLEKTGATLIFATTTPFPDRPDGPLREAAMTEKYNAVALKVMTKHDVMVADLHATVEKKLKQLQLPNNVHFKGSGYKVLAGEVAKHIRRALVARKGEAR